MPSLAEIARFILQLIIAAAVFGLLYFLVEWLALPQPFGRVAMGVIMVGGVFTLIAMLLNVAGVNIWKNPQ